MSRYDRYDYRDDYYDDDDDYYDDRPTREDLVETLKDIEALTMDYNGEPIYAKSVNRVFYDIFGIKDVGYIFSSNARRATRSKVEIVRACKKERLIDMFADGYTRRAIQTLVKLHYDINRKKKIDNATEVSEAYSEVIYRIQKMYGIRTRSSVSSISDPYKTLRKLNREYEDTRGYDDYYDDYDRDYRDYDDYGSRRRLRRREDDYYDDTDVVASILEGVDPDVIKRKGNKRSRSERDRRDRDRNREYDDDTDYDIIDRLDKIEQKIDRRDDSREYDDDRGYDSKLESSLDIINKSILEIAEAQDQTRKDVDSIIDVLHNALTEDDDEDTSQESPGDKKESNGDLMKTTGGIITDPKQLK